MQNEQFSFKGVKRSATESVDVFPQQQDWAENK